ncbi:MAG: ParM/StbA family protein [Proteobacteria bacterium]|nr:ParM/StbA family protein [Pseudomonadota bacterium]
MSIVAIDIGFGFTKATDGTKDVIFKSILGEATEIQFQDELFPRKKQDLLNIKIEGKNYFAGELAERQSNVRLFTLDQTQFITQFSKVLALVTLGNIVDNYDNVNLVTGLPVGYYKQYKDALASSLLGEHKFSLIKGSNEEVEKIFTIGKIRIIPQPYGSLLNVFLDDEGKAKNTDLFKQKIGIIDIGFRTTDYIISDKLQYSERGSKTTDNGISKAFSVIANKLREKSAVNVEIFKIYEPILKGSIKIKGKEYDLTSVREQVLQQLASQIASDTERFWIDDWDIDSILISGGGGSLLEKYLKPLLPNAQSAFDSSIDGRFFNVKGYLKYGKSIWFGEK